MTQRLDISIGPVQGFVAQSRRTRDLWGSSYLLSFLTAHAMRGAQQADGRVKHPKVDQDPLFRWVSGRPTGDPPAIGSVPNHFVVTVADDARRVAEAAERCFQEAWQRVCKAVWQRFVEPVCAEGNGTRAIWERQVTTFWEFTWTAGPCDHGNLLARRKHWRSHLPLDEPGEKCSVMHNLQELSGYVRARSRTEQDAFWRRITYQEGVGKLNVRDNERLSAIALVKRLFPKVAKDAIGWRVDATHWPSTVRVAATPWIRGVAELAPDHASQYARAVKKFATGVLSERARFPVGPAVGDFPRLDANYLHRDSVANERLCPLSDSAASGARDELRQRLDRIYDLKDGHGRPLGSPPTFYALLVADGDRLGKLVHELGGEAVSEALLGFTVQVSEVIREHDGVTVYAGGDDVLAMLPVPRALACAHAVAEAYRCTFVSRMFGGASAPPDAAQATLSAAVLFAHIRMPLNYVLGEVRHLLDDVAKDGNGRNSLAAAVLKPGGLHCQWATIWNRPTPDGQTHAAVELLQDLQQQIQTETKDAGLTSSLIYRIRDLLTRLCGWDQWRPGQWGVLPDTLAVQPFLHAEIHHSLDERMDDGAASRADEIVPLVWNLLMPARNGPPRPNTASGEAGRRTTQAGIDALLLARFLANPEHEVGGA
ncbi:MAG: type III-B CRISPR-associated protein Cas10/Cmr2 [Gammaproteobacteria bacterium]|nr:type III-B CRISPR-associated protein Cas10/Cmr2 [Gammaproteobacteria bacterium]